MSASFARALGMARHGRSRSGAESAAVCSTIEMHVTPRRGRAGYLRGGVVVAFVLTCMLAHFPVCASLEPHDTGWHHHSYTGTAVPETSRIHRTTLTEGHESTVHDVVDVVDESIIKLPASPPRRALRQSSDTTTVSTATELIAAITNDEILTISLTADLILSVNLPPIEHEKAIVGACGARGTDACALNANGFGRILIIGSVASVTLNNLILKNGAVQSADPPMSNGGALFVFGTLIGHRLSFEGNRATADGTSVGGAIAVSGGTVLLTECLFIDNQSSDDGGAIYASSGTVEVRRSTFESCVAGGLGGGIAGDSASIVIRYCTFDDFIDAREFASRDAYTGATGAVYLEPFAIYSDYYADDGTLLIDDSDAEITGATTGPPEGYSYKVEGAGLVSSGAFEPPPPGMGFAPPPPLPGTSSDTGNVTLVDSTAATTSSTSLPLEFIAGAVAALLVLLWLLGRFFNQQHHNHRPSEQTLKHMRDADDAMLEMRRLEDQQEADALRDAAREDRARRLAGKNRVERTVSNWQFSSMKVTAEDGYDTEGVRFDDDDDVVGAVMGLKQPTEEKSPETKQSFSDTNGASTPPNRKKILGRAHNRKAILNDHVGGVFDESEDNGAFADGGDDGAEEPRVYEDENIHRVSHRSSDAMYEQTVSDPDTQTQLPPEDHVLANVENRSRSGSFGRQSDRGRSSRLDRIRNLNLENLNENDGVFDATSERVTAETIFVKASWQGAAAAARVAQRFSRGALERLDGGGSGGGSDRNTERPPGRLSACTDIERTDLQPVSPVSRTRVRDMNRPLSSIASIASASSATRAVLAARGVGNGARMGNQSSARIGSTEALRARIEAARRAAANSGNVSGSVNPPSRSNNLATAPSPRTSSVNFGEDETTE